MVERAVHGQGCAAAAAGPVARRLDDAAGALRRIRVPRRLPGARLVLAGHVAAAAWAGRSRRPPLRRALLHLGVMEAALRTFGRDGMFQNGDVFHPFFLLPDFHGPHFDEALRRLLLPGRGPFVAHLAVTGACPCRCTYCYAGAGGADAPDLGDERLFEVAAGLARKGVPLVNLSGGEPLARFDRVVRLVEMLAPGAEVRLATSGVGLTPERSERLRRAGLRVLAVSLDSADAVAVNTARGHPRAFSSAVDALRWSAEAGLVTFATAVVDGAGPRTSADVHRLLSFVAGVHPTVVVNFVPRFATGRAASAGGFRSPAEYAPVARRIGRAIREGGHRANVFLDPLELLMGCVGAGRRQLNVDIDGNVTACISGAGFGNVGDEPFDVLYERFAAGGARLKRGFFCASIGDGAGGRKTLSPDESLRALAKFHDAHPDTLFQRVLDVAAGPVAWLAEG